MQKFAAVLASLIAVCVGVFPAAAEVRFTLEEAGGTPFIYVQGEFASRDELSVFSELVRDHRPAFVTFDSPGGNVLKAIALGRMIRAAGLSTVQIRQLECASACAFAFFGGVSREAAPGAIGMHKISFPASQPIDADDAVRSVQDLTAAILGYMREMGVDPALLELSLAYDATDIRYLSGTEMARYNVVTRNDVTHEQQRGVPLSPKDERVVADLPVARSGRIRHPKGNAPLKAHPGEKTDDLRFLPNGTPVQIAEDRNGWYGVTVEGKTGYLHHSWVFVDQFIHGEFDSRYIQIKSFNSLELAERYVRSSPLPLAAMLATNGWFAVTLDGTLSLSEASTVLRRLKAEGTISSDSHVTYGNTYVAKVCCAALER